MSETLLDVIDRAEPPTSDNSKFNSAPRETEPILPMPPAEQIDWSLTNAQLARRHGKSRQWFGVLRARQRKASYDNTAKTQVANKAEAITSNELGAIATAGEAVTKNYLSEQTVSSTVETKPSQDPVEIGNSPVAAADGSSSRAPLFRRVIVSAVKGIAGIANSIVRVFASAAEIDDDFTERSLAKCKPDDDAIDQFQESLDAVMQKYGWQPKGAEEIALCVSGARLAAPYLLLIATFKGEIARKKRSEQKTSASL